MRSVSKRQKLHDPQAICSVTSFTARPLLRVGGKDKGTRFLSFVDAMLGFKHLLTAEDLGKAASLCTSMRGQLQSRFLVLSDDKPLPPPPVGRGKRRHSGDLEQDQPSKTLRQGGQSQAKASKTHAQASGSSAGAQFQVVQGRRGKKSLPDGVVPIPTRTTPRRAAKTTRAQDDQSDEISEGVVEVVSGSESGSNDEDATSDKTVVFADWVILSSSEHMLFMTILLTLFSTTPSLLITDFTNFVMSWVGLSIARRRLMISQCTVTVVLS